jgi:hypothetical protein
MLAHDLTHGRQTQAIASQTRGEERLENGPQCRLVHAAPAIAHRDPHIGSGCQVAMGERSSFGNLAYLGFDLDAAGMIRRLRRIVAEIKKHLLHLSGVAVYNGGFRHLADNQLNLRRQRGMQQGSRFGDQFLQIHLPAIRLPAAAECEYLIDEITRSLACTADLLKITAWPAIRRELPFRHFRITEDRADDIVKVMRDTAGESPDRFHAAGALKIRLQARPFLLKMVSRHDIGDGVESHSQQAKFARLRDDARLECIEAEDRLTPPSPIFQTHTQPCRP